MNVRQKNLGHAAPGSTCAESRNALIKAEVYLFDNVSDNISVQSADDQYWGNELTIWIAKLYQLIWTFARLIALGEHHTAKTESRFMDDNLHFRSVCL